MMYSLYTLKQQSEQLLNTNQLYSYRSLLKKEQLIILELKELLKSSSMVSPDPLE